jgi:hypothetical protein
MRLYEILTALKILHPENSVIMPLRNINRTTLCDNPEDHIKIMRLNGRCGGNGHELPLILIQQL